MKKYIKIEEGSYRSKDMSGRVFPILKDYQKFTGGKDGGFVTVNCSEFDGFEGLDKGFWSNNTLGFMPLSLRCSILHIQLSHI